MLLVRRAKKRLTRPLVIQIRQLPRETKRWDARVGLDTYLKNLLKSLRSISDLRSKALRSRHWNQLMEETGVQIDISRELYLKDLLALKLHNYEETVNNIVDTAQKELRMENMLAEVEAGVRSRGCGVACSAASQRAD